MSKAGDNSQELSIHNSANYDIDSLESEIRAEQHAAELLRQYHGWLVGEQNKEALEAGALAAGADYFIRQFVIGAKRINLFKVSAAEVRQFGGNWYIINNLEPNAAELEPMLRGTGLFYQYCTGLNLFDSAQAMEIQAQVADLVYFRKRIEDFFQIEGDGYKAWSQECPLTS